MKKLLFSVFLLTNFSNWNIKATPVEIDQGLSSSVSQPHQSKPSQLPRSIWGITEDQLDDLFATSTDLIVLADEHYYHRVNDRWTEVLGWSREDLLSCPHINFVHPENIKETEEAANYGINSSCIINFKNRYRTKRGSYHSMEWLVLKQVSGSDCKASMLAIGHDLTLEQAANDQQYSLVRAQEATKLKSSFVAHMSHEIRTPLNGILGFLEMTLEEPLPDKVRSYVEHAQTSSQLLLGVANDIIDISKIEAGALKVEKIDFNPFRSVKSVLALLTLQATKKNLILTSNLDPNLPPLLCGDENRLKQILFNLLGNAIKFTSQGTVSLKMTGQLQAGNPPQFVLRGRIKDTGIGIAPEFLSKLFQPFSQEDQNMRRQFGGAGLGLYITKQLCERMGGTVDVISHPGQGSTFQFHIIVDQPVTRSPRSSPKISALGLEEFVAPLPLLSRILVVEDNLLNQKVIANHLMKLNYNFDIIENGLLSVQAAQTRAYNLILMDGEMPVMDGLEATREIRKVFSAQQLPIIGVSAHVMSDQRDLFIASGMNGYLAKPITRHELAQEIIRCFQGLTGRHLLPI